MSTLASSPAPTTAGLRVPDFFIVGHHKSGTTALYAMLREHPQIFMPKLKEPRFLASDLKERFRQPREPEYPHTLDEYLALFAGARAEQRVGEATAIYLCSHAAAGRIAELQPAARIIAILREPASFLHSLHLTFLRAHVESKKDLRKAMALEQARREGRSIPRRSHIPQLLQYSDQVRYVEQLRRYEAHFPREQILVLVYEEFLADNVETVRRVMRFLDVDAEQPVVQQEKNVTKRKLRSHVADDVVHSVTMGSGPVSRAVKGATKAFTTHGIRQAAYGVARRGLVMGSAPPPDERLMEELRIRFKPEVVALSEHLDRDLVALWKYDQVA